MEDLVGVGALHLADRPFDEFFGVSAAFGEWFEVDGGLWVSEHDGVPFPFGCGV